MIGERKFTGVLIFTVTPYMKAIFNIYKNIYR